MVQNILSSIYYMLDEIFHYEKEYKHTFSENYIWYSLKMSRKDIELYRKEL